MSTSSALRGVLGGVALAADQRPRHQQHERGRAERDQQLAPGAVEREPDRGQDHERQEAGRRPVARLAHQPDDAEVGEREPELRRRAVAHDADRADATSSASVSATAMPNSSGSRPGPGQQRRERAGRRRRAERDARPAARLAPTLAEHDPQRDQRRDDDDDRQLAPEQPALEALVGLELGLEVLMRRSPTVPVFSVFSHAISARRSSAT